MSRSASAPRRAQATYRLIVGLFGAQSLVGRAQDDGGERRLRSTTLTSSSSGSTRNAAGRTNGRKREPKSPLRDVAADLRQRLKPTERAHDLGVELRPGPFSNARDCLLVVERVAEGARAGHRVVGVGDVDDARGERYPLARQPFGVARPVEVLVVMSHRRGDLLHLRHSGQQARAALRVEPDDGALFLGERGRLEQDGVGRADLADVVE